MLIGLPRLDGQHESAGLSVAIADAAATIRARFGDRAAPKVRLLPRAADAELLAKFLESRGTVHPAFHANNLIDHLSFTAATIYTKQAGKQRNSSAS